MNGARVCAVCGESMVGAHHLRKYCSDGCAAAARVAKQQQQLDALKQARRARAVERQCKHCGGSFKTTHATKVFCSNECREAEDLKWQTIKTRRIRAMFADDGGADCWVG